MDTNILCIAQDFDTFQSAINKIHTAVMELQDANKDVLVGKRNVNCLSCGVDASANKNIVQGRDGRCYKGEYGPASSKAGNMTMVSLKDEPTKYHMVPKSRAVSSNIGKHVKGNSKTGEFFDMMRDERAKPYGTFGDQKNKSVVLRPKGLLALG